MPGYANAGTIEALVEYPYTAQQDDELALKPGDIITNITKMPGGWWKGQNGGKIGMFPDNFVKEITPDPKVDPKSKQQSTPNQNGKSGGNVHELTAKLQDSLTNPGPTKRQGGSSVRKKLRAKVSFSYAPQNPDELELTLGDVIEIENQEEEGWWEGSVNGKRGVFPSNFVDLVDVETPAPAPEPAAETEDGEEIKAKPLQKGFGFGNIFADPGGASVLQRVKKSKSQDDSLGKSEPKTKVPSDRKASSVKESSASVEPPVTNSPSHTKMPAKQAPVPPPKVPSKVAAPPTDYSSNDAGKGERARVLFPYTAENGDELSIDIGQVINILEKELEDSGWWKGELDGNVGVFPDNFVELIKEEKLRKPGPPVPSAPAKSKSPPPQPQKVPRTGASEEHPVLPPLEPDHLTSASPATSAASKKAAPPPVVAKKPNPARPADPKLIAQTDDHKVQEQKTGLYIDTAEPNHPLEHITKTRPKAPTKRPPTKKEASPETEVHNGPLPERPQTTESKSTPSAGVVGASSSEVASLRAEIESLRANTVPKEQHEQLQKQLTQLQATVEEMGASLEKRLYNVMCELDEEKKLRHNAVIDMERVKKLLAP